VKGEGADCQGKFVGVRKVRTNGKGQGGTSFKGRSVKEKEKETGKFSVITKKKGTKQVTGGTPKRRETW